MDIKYAVKVNIFLFERSCHPGVQEIDTRID
jgi:hypothetical protein